MQSAASSLSRLRESVMHGLFGDRPALFSVYSGILGEQAPYLIAAAATESRAFPGFVYNPSSGSDLTARFLLDGNPQSQHDWSRHSIQYEDAGHNTKTKEIVFTLVDFMACNKHFASHFASVAAEQWDSDMLPVDAFLELGAKSRPGKVPYILVLDEDNVLQRVVCDDKLIDAAQRCQQRWHTLQELARAKEQLIAQASIRPATDSMAATAATPTKTVAKEPQQTTAAIESAAEPAPPEAAGTSSVDPWIETIRCTTCNECTELNSRMFAYDDDKRAHIVDADAGTYRELVEAAEACQVAIIHPGQPRSPDEPGLEELLERAEPFNS